MQTRKAEIEKKQLEAKHKRSEDLLRKKKLLEVC